jgi:chromatin segregation and condensation protein Rec8/ScpA/Scc1 (kleisin family)
MAMLELSKMRRIQVYQSELMGPVWMYRMDLDETVLPLPTASAELANV